MISKNNLISISFKFLLLIILFTTFVTSGFIFTHTTSGKLSDEKFAKDIFTHNLNGKYVATEQFFNHKLFLQDNGDYLELKIADELLNNRWIEGASNKINWSNDTYGYSVSIISESENSKGVVVFGKNKDAKTIKIIFNKNTYSTFISPDEFFIITYPIFETLNKDTDIYNIYSTGKSKDLKVIFTEDENIYCKHMKLIK